MAKQKIKELIIRYKSVKLYKIKPKNTLAFLLLARY